MNGWKILFWWRRRKRRRRGGMMCWCLNNYRGLALPVARYRNGLMAAWKEPIICQESKFDLEWFMWDSENNTTIKRKGTEAGEAGRCVLLYAYPENFSVNRKPLSVVIEVQWTIRIHRHPQSVIFYLRQEQQSYGIRGKGWSGAKWVIWRSRKAAGDDLGWRGRTFRRIADACFMFPSNRGDWVATDGLWWMVVLVVRRRRIGGRWSSNISMYAQCVVILGMKNNLNKRTLNAC